MLRKRSRVAFIGVIALALCMMVGLSAGAVEAKKKKVKNPGGTVDITKPVNAQIPNATGTGTSFRNGLLSSTIDVPAAKPFIGTVVRDVNVTVQTTGDTPADIPSGDGGSASQLTARVTAPSGATAWLFGDFFNPLVGQSIGPLTIDDQSPNALGFLPPASAPNQLVSPYAGSAQVKCFSTRGGGCAMAILNNGPATGTWTLRFYDNVGGTPVETSRLDSWRLTVVAGRNYKVKNK
jgi:hypothetical protein